MLKVMMAPEPQKRPALDKVVEALRHEKRQRASLIDPLGPIEVAKSPKYLSTFEINPQFRFTYCGREELGAVSFSAFIDRAANYF